MKQIKIGKTTFYKNSLPKELNKTNKFDLNVGIFYEKNVTDPIDIYSVWDLLPKKQPTKKEIKRAMIWQYGIKGEKPDYIIAAKGGSISDNMFISEFWNEIVDPETGYDKHVILLKILSNDFNSILITDDLIRKLAKHFISGKKKKLFDYDAVESTIGFLVRSNEGKKIKNINGEMVTVNKNMQNKIINQMKIDYSIDLINNVIDEKINRFKYLLNHIIESSKINGGTHLNISYFNGSLEDAKKITGQDISRNRKRIKYLENLKNFN